jgi:cell division protease FtsH
MVLVAIGVLVWNFSSKFQNTPQAISFSEFVSMVDSGQVASVDISGNEITGLNKGGESFRTYNASAVRRPRQPSHRPQHHRPRQGAVRLAWGTVLMYWAPILLMIGFWVFFMRQVQSGGNKALSFGKSKAKLSSSAQKKVTFRDVSGVDEAKEELQEIIDFSRSRRSSRSWVGASPRACC